MRYRSHLVRRTLASGLTVLFVAPLLGGLHHHEVDHDGVASHHIEPAHGGHGQIIPDVGDRLRASGLEGPTPVELPATLELDRLLGVQIVSVARRALSYSGRAPPGEHRSRAPPSLA